MLEVGSIILCYEYLLLFWSYNVALEFSKSEGFTKEENIYLSI